MFKYIKKIILDRIFLLIICFSLGFYFLIYNLYNLQINEGESYIEIVDNRTETTIKTTAPRGEIFDFYGVPLAVNTSVYNLKIDLNIDLTNEKLNESIYELIKLFEENDESFIFDLPISKNMPYEFSNNQFAVNTFKKNIYFKPTSMSDDEFNIMIEELTEQETINKLYDLFKISDNYQEQYKIQIASIRYSQYIKRFYRYIPITIAYNISQKTVSTILENNDKFPNFFVETETLRHYPFAESHSHILGYTGIISQNEIDYYVENEIDYTNEDIVGKVSLEKYYEDELKGITGTTTMKITPEGKSHIVTEEVQPIKGNNIFITIDSDLQNETYKILEKNLTNIIISKLTRINNRERNITTNEFLISMLESNNVDYKKLEQHYLYSKVSDYKNSQLDILNKNLENETITEEEYIKQVEELTNKQIFINLVETNVIDQYEILSLFLDQHIITADDNVIEQIENKSINVKDFIVDKLLLGEITPQMTNLDPSTASAVVVDINNGNILAAVSYPSYDNNKLVNNVNDEYLEKLYSDPTTPSVYRAFSERRAPGSTFKMITGIAALEEEYITPTSTIYDEIVFTKAGFPHANCWSSVSHGRVNVSQALEVSCNYFFFESAYMMGNSRTGNGENSIDILNNYMVMFGLNDATGAEIIEYADNKPIEYIISSPEYKEYLAKLYNDEPSYSQLEWFDGDTIRTAIGQSENNYTPAQLAKYVATIANGGTRYSLHFLDNIVNYKNEIIYKYEPNVELELNLKDSTIDAIHTGMYLASNGSRGTATSIIGSFPITIAGKTGTTEQSTSRPNHTSFASFAPFENPEIAMYIQVPFGGTFTTSTPSVVISEEIYAYYFGLNTEPEYKESSNKFVW